MCLAAAHVYTARMTLQPVVFRCPWAQLDDELGRLASPLGSVAEGSWSVGCVREQAETELALFELVCSCGWP